MTDNKNDKTEDGQTTGDGPGKLEINKETLRTLEDKGGDDGPDRVTGVRCPTDALNTACC